MYRVYKSLVTKWNPNRNPSNKVEAEAEAKFQEINEPFKVSHIYIYIFEYCMYVHNCIYLKKKKLNSVYKFKKKRMM